MYLTQVPSLPSTQPFGTTPGMFRPAHARPDIDADGHIFKGMT